MVIISGKSRASSRATSRPSTKSKSKKLSKKGTMKPRQNPKSRTLTTTSTTKSKKQLQFGKLSRAEKEQLIEYGEIDPIEALQTEEDDNNINDESGDEKDNRVRKGRVFREEDLDHLNDLQRKRKSQKGYYASSSNNNNDDDDGSEEDEEQDLEAWAPKASSSYKKLVNLFARNSKNSVHHKRRKLEEEGIEEEEEEVEDNIDGEEESLDEEEEEDEEEESLDSEDEAALEDEEAMEFLKEVGTENIESEEEELDADGNVVNEEEEHEEDSDEEEGVAGKSKDPMTRHFSDSLTEDLPYITPLIDAKKWKPSMTECDTLQQITTYTLENTEMTQSLSQSTPLPAKSLDTAGVKTRLHTLWRDLKLSPDTTTDFTQLQEKLFERMNTYQDLLFSNQTIQNTSEIRHIIALHTMNHIHKTRDRVLKTTTKLKLAQSSGKEMTEVRDQGFTRPKVLILVPFRNAAFEIVNLLIKLSGSTQQDNRKRFMDDFSLPKDEDVVDERKPEDYKELFKGNIDDCFRIGIKFSRRNMKLYSEFYSSDVIIASPLGLRMIVGAKGDKHRDFDFLSSIEILIMDQSTTFLMQNFDHLSHILDHTNLIPKDPHGCDFSRVKNWYLDGKAKYFRQTIIFNSFLTPEFNALFNTLTNYAGKSKIKQSSEGTITEIIQQVPQIFQRIPITSFMNASEERFDYFVEKVLPSLRNNGLSIGSHTAIFVASYLDFVKLRNYFQEYNYSFIPLSEYSSNEDISRARGLFFHGKKKILLTTERFHFFRRYKLRGIHKLVFYSLPDHGGFYSEFVNFMEQMNVEKEVTVLFDRLDKLKLERVVGTKRVRRMIEGDKEAFMFA